MAALMPDRRWPNQFDYDNALLMDAVDDQALSDREIVRRINGGPPDGRVGNAGIVYHYVGAGQPLALKVFRRNNAELRDRQMLISQFVQSSGASRANCFVALRYLDRGVAIRDHWYPAVVMEWSKGRPIDSYVFEAVRSRRLEELNRLPSAWLELLSTMGGLGVIHGDLQHGNVLVEDDGVLRLIDYDGMLAPAMSGKFGTYELGHRAYQHPLVGQGDKDIDMRVREDFSALVMLVNLLAAAQGSPPWSIDNPQEHEFGLSPHDLGAPDRSDAVERLLKGGGAASEATALLCRAIDEILFSTDALREASALVSGVPAAQSVADANGRVVTPDLDGQIADLVARAWTDFRISHALGVSEAVVRSRRSVLARGLDVTRLPFAAEPAVEPVIPIPDLRPVAKPVTPRPDAKPVLNHPAGDEPRTLTDVQRTVVMAVRTYGTYVASAPHVNMNRQAVGATMRQVRELLGVTTDRQAFVKAELRKLIPPAAPSTVVRDAPVRLETPPIAHVTPPPPQSPVPSPGTSASSVAVFVIAAVVTFLFMIIVLALL